MPMPTREAAEHAASTVYTGAFDSATGRIWFYSATNFRGPPEDVGILEEPGRRLGR